MDEKYLSEVKKIIAKYIDPEQNTVFVFGSRALGTASKFSDYDIGIEGMKLSPTTYFDLESEFEESDIPYTVDIVDFNNVSENFRRVAKTKIIPLNY